MLDGCYQAISSLELGANRAKLCQVIRDRNITYVDQNIQNFALEHEVYRHDLVNDLPPDKNNFVNAIYIIDKTQGILEGKPDSDQYLAFFFLWPFCAYEVTSPTPTSHTVLLDASLFSYDQ